MAPEKSAAPLLTNLDPAVEIGRDEPGLNVLFIINPAAGRRTSPRLADQLHEAFRGPVAVDPAQPSDASLPTHTVSIAFTEKPGHAVELAADFARRFREEALIVACGGDGTAHEVANGVLGTPAAMTILPLGTGNDFARAALSSLDLATLLPRLQHAVVRPIDLLSVNGKICLNITSFGFDTRVQRLMMQINRRLHLLGRFAYPLAIVAGLLGNKRFQIRCQLEAGESEIRSYILAALCNGRYYGGGFNPAPAARLDDGLLDLILVDPLPLHRILKLIPLYKKGRHLADPAVHHDQVQKGVLAALPGQVLLGNIDGELFTTDQLTFTVLPRAIRFAFY